MGWLRLGGSFTLSVSFAKGPHISSLWDIFNKQYISVQDYSSLIHYQTIPWQCTMWSCRSLFEKEPLVIFCARARINSNDNSPARSRKDETRNSRRNGNQIPEEERGNPAWCPQMDSNDIARCRKDETWNSRWNGKGNPEWFRWCSRNSRRNSDPRQRPWLLSSKKLYVELIWRHEPNVMHSSYGVATLSRIDKIIGLFCRIKSLL